MFIRTYRSAAAAKLGECLFAPTDGVSVTGSGADANSPDHPVGANDHSPRFRLATVAFLFAIDCRSML